MIKFGVARKYGKDLLKYIDMLSSNSVDTYEMGFAFGVPQKFPKEFILHAKESKVILSGHLPFWINLGNESNNENNIRYLIDGLRVAEELSSTIVFHLGFYGNNDFETIKRNILFCIKEALNYVELKNGRLGIETTGKQKAIGTIEEIIDIINIIDNKNVIPIIDWSHIFARSNGEIAKDYDSYIQVLTKFENYCNRKLDYFHGGSVIFDKGNEKKHISARNLKPSMPLLLSVLKDMGYKDYTLIIESPDSINDIKWLRSEVEYINQNIIMERGVVDV